MILTMTLSRRQRKEIPLEEVAAYTRAQINELRKIYKKAAKDLQKLLLSEDLSSFNRGRSESILRQAELIIKGLESDTLDWAEVVLPLSYGRGIDIAARQVLRLGIVEEVDRFALIHTAAVSVLTDVIVADVVKAGSEIRQLVSSFVRRAQIDRNLDREITRRIAEGLIAGSHTREVGSQLYREFRQRISDGHFVRIGNRNYELGSYLELVAQTRTREATTEGTLNTAALYGMDLVIWDVHDNPCPQCQPYAGRVFSISGTNEDFPPLIVRPPVHPRCECSVHPTTDTKLEDVGLYDRLVALSRNGSIPILNQDNYEEILGKSAMDIAKADADILGNLEEALSL